MFNAVEALNSDKHQPFPEWGLLACCGGPFGGKQRRHCCECSEPLLVAVICRALGLVDKALSEFRGGQSEFALASLPGDGKLRATKLLRLIDQKREHHQPRQYHRQVLMAMAKIVLELVGQTVLRHLPDLLKQKRVAVRFDANDPSESIFLQVSDHWRVRIQRVGQLDRWRSRAWIDHLWIDHLLKRLVERTKQRIGSKMFSRRGY